MSRCLSFTSILLILILFSCQKEKSFEQGKPSKGSLQSASGDCLPKRVEGVYRAGKSLNDSNFIEVTIDVTETGRYTVQTDTVNGYFFRGTGNFAGTGAQTVRLKGYGTPGATGTDDFAVFFDSSLCFISVNVLSNGPTSGGTAVFTLQGSGANCLNFTPLGTYTQGSALSTSNKVNLEVNVTTIGTWIMGTSTVSGFAFNGSGTFTSTGIQTITLDAVGTPTASGAQVFNVAVGSSSCSFTINVVAGPTPPPNTGDYFPRTVGSHWTYMWDGDPTDTMRWDVISQTKTVAGNTYNIFMADDGFSVDTLGYFRKSGSDYFQWGDVGFEMDFDNSLYAEVTMLKDNQAANYTWNSNSFTGTILGQSVTARKKYTITQKNVTITSNGVQYPNTIAVKIEYQVNPGLTWVSIPQHTVFYYTRNYGVTKVQFYDAPNTLSETLELISFKIF